MNNLIPQSLEELSLAESRENHINIAGYGRESTHKGYLSWILDSRRCSIAKELIACLIEVRIDQPQKVFFIPESTDSINCISESKMGRRPIDLVVKIQKFALEKTIRYIPIELKTDSGPGKNQFENFSTFLASRTDYSDCFVFRLGSSSVQNYDEWRNFALISPKNIIDIWGEYLDKSPAFFKCWMEAIGMEEARRQLAHQVYLQCRVEANSFQKYGYRAWKHLMYYVYDGFKNYMHDKADKRTWSIYDGQYNAVLNLSLSKEGSTKINGLNGVGWYFEFNDECFCLKLQQNSDNLEAVANWVHILLEKIKNDEPAKETRPHIKKTATWKKGWPMIAFWDTNFIDFEDTYHTINKIIQALRRDGLLGTL